MTRVELSAQAANLQRSVGSISTCTLATVESLKTLLLPESTCGSHSKNALTQSADGVPGRPPKGRLAKSTKQYSVAICEDLSPRHETTKTKERLAFATIIVNETLKSLTNAAKKTIDQNNSCPQIASLARCTSGCSNLDDAAPRGQSPLQQINANQNIGPSRRGVKRNSSTNSGNKNDGLKAQAHCARIGFACLRTLQAQEKSINLPYLQLEMGMSALVHKFIALGFFDLAVKELRILRKRLLSLYKGDSHVAESSHCNSKHAYKGPDPSPRKESVIELLSFGHISDRGPLLSLITTTQLQLLKILATVGVYDIGELIKKLRLDEPGCPALLIQHQIESTQEQTEEKAVHQLVTLAQVILKICDQMLPISGVKRPVPSAENILELRIIALQTKARWWYISQHTIDMTKDLAVPFAGFLDTYRRYSGASKEDQYHYAQKAFVAVTNLPQIDIRHHNQSLIPLYRILADLAHAAGQPKDVALWVDKAMGFLEDAKASQLPRCIVACHFATLRLRAESDQESPGAIITLLNKAAECLNGDLHGDSTELNELLVVVSSLRKSVSAVILRSRGDREDVGAQVPHELVNECLKLLALSMRFIVRYLGSAPGREANERNSTRYKHRATLVSSLVPSTIAAVSTLGRLYARSPLEEWDQVNAALQDCIELATCLEGSGFGEEQYQKTIQSSPFALISNAYWCRYLSLSRVSADFREQKHCLRTSIALIKHCKHDVQREGSLLLKLEHYGILYESARDYRGALEIYEESLQAHINLGVVAKAAEAAMTSSLATIFDHHEMARLLSRTLLAYFRVASKLKEAGATLSLYYDPCELPVGQRMLLLDHQYSAMVSKLHSRSNASIYYSSIRGLTKTLLTLSSRDESAVRRLHLVVQMVYLRTIHPAALDESLLSPVLDEYGNQISPTASSPSTTLQNYTCHLISSLALLVALREHKPNLNNIEETLRSWLDLLEQCPDFDALQSHVYDMKSWVLQLEMVLGYFDAQGLDYLKTLALQVSTKICESLPRNEFCETASKWTELGMQYTKLGYSGLASVTLQRAQRYLKGTDGSSTSATNMKWHLASAELALETQDYRSCNGHIQAIREAVGEISQLYEEQRLSSKRIQLQWIAADTDMLQSRLTAAEGHIYEALLFARLGVKSYHQIWSSIVRQQSNLNTTPSSCADESVNETLTNTLSELSISEQPPKLETSKHAALQSAAFWKLVPRLFKGLLQLSGLFAHTGLYPEADYYLKQSQKIAIAVHASAWLSQYLMLEAQYASRLGRDSEALNLLKQAYQIVGDTSHDQTFATLQTRLAVCYARNGQTEAGDFAVTMARGTLRKLKSRPYLDNLLHKQSITENLTTQVNQLALDKVEPAPPSRPKTRVAVSKVRAETSAATKVPQPFSDELSAIDLLALYQMEATTCRECAAAALGKGDLELASEQLDEADSMANNPRDIVPRAISRAEVSLYRCLQDLARDPVYSIMPESAISLPSINNYGQCAETKPNTTDPCKTNQPPRKPTAKAIVRKVKQNVAVEQRGLISSLQAAQRTITDIIRHAQDVAATNSLYHAMNVLLRITMMLTTLSSPRCRIYDSATFMVYIIELGRMTSMSRESLAIRVEQRLLEKIVDRQLVLAPDAKELSFVGGFELTNFRTLYIDIIPHSWSVASITLSDSAEEIIITKIRSSKAPFVLRVPFKRQTAVDSNDESFGFQEARKELRDIVDLANRSSQDAGDLSRKGAKTQWWNTRSALDARLKDLLNNIEDNWLGGFRGIFARNLAKPNLLARFQQSLENIMGRHLPSRQKAGKRKQAGRVILDPQVLELFVSLGCPSETNDIDESLMDLLYFVVDILQFNGERNAYDEIDFDSIVIETLDALRQYHQAIRDEADDGDREHIILILDKQLHCFPWESLPCMKGRSISRLPSLACLRKRIMQQRERKPQGSSLSSARDGLHVERQKGAFVLNPAGDLSNTQTRFEDPMRELSSWEGIVQREPQEAEMKHYLENHEVFLYFGHGSGGQYIRSRTIKRLEKCAVALLMGCSSGALAEVGDFESYGTPINYMHAGCPALLATLWDVTDKDIDRFSQTVLEKWGLFKDRQRSMLSSPVKSKAKQKGKGRVLEMPKVEGEAKSPLSLDEAVAHARDSCILPYLNGAAPVVYGVPVFLD
ncbi:MAG: hypothetical protein Q9217_000073 [Psora testacea]